MVTDEFRTICESIAVKVRHELDLWGYDPLPARQLAEHMQIDLYAPSELPGMSENDVAQAIGSSGWSAITVLTQPPMIIYHPGHPPPCFESNIMHELAHIVLGHKPELLGLISDLRVARCYSKFHEAEADCLGVCLQLPRVALQLARQRGTSVSEIACQFNTALDLVYERMRSSS
jgi:hypothetical protein